MSEDNGKGYGCFVMFVAGVALLIALIALRRWDVPLCALSESDFSVADVLAILVTVLIAGQLWQSMVTKEDLKKVDNAVKEVERLKTEIAQTRELPQGIYWTLLGRREQAAGEVQGNRFAIQFYARSLRHFVAAQADYNHFIHDALVGIRACMTNIGNNDIHRYSELSNEILANIDAAEESISQMTENLREAFREIEVMRTLHRDFTERASRQTAEASGNPN